MPIHFTLTETDYLAALRLHGRALLPWRWLGYGLLLLNSVLFILGSGETNLLFLTSLICPAVSVLAGLVVLATVILPALARRNFRNMKELTSPQTIDVTPVGLRSQSASGQAVRPWSYFGQWKEDERLVLLYLNPLQFLILPKRAFTDPAALAALRAHLAKHAQPRSGRNVQQLYLTALLLVLTAFAIYQVLSFFI